MQVAYQIIYKRLVSLRKQDFSVMMKNKILSLSVFTGRVLCLTRIKADPWSWNAIPRYSFNCNTIGISCAHGGGKWSWEVPAEHSLTTQHFPLPHAQIRSIVLQIFSPPNVCIFVPVHNTSFKWLVLWYHFPFFLSYKQVISWAVLLVCLCVRFIYSSDKYCLRTGILTGQVQHFSFNKNTVWMAGFEWQTLNSMNGYEWQANGRV